MLPISDRTRRRITLVFFAMLCVVPTLVVAAWGVSWHLPGHLRDESQRLGWQLGMKVSIAAVTHPRPGVVRYEGLVLANPETGEEIVRCPLLEAAWGDAKGGTDFKSVLVGGPVLRLRAVQPEIEATGLEEVRRLVDRVLAGRAGPLDGRIRMAVDSLVIRSDRGPQSFCDVEGVVETLPEGTLATIKFRVGGQAMQEPARLYVARDRQRAIPVSFVKLDTAGNELPWSVLALAADGRGDAAHGRFCGEIYGRETAEGWDVQASGEFDRLELERLFGRRSAAQMARRGSATAGGRE